MSKDAIRFTEDDSYKGKGIYFQNQGSEFEIAITKNDKNYIVGDRLYIEYKGMKIFTSLDNIILINKKDDTIQIIPYKELAKPEEREYLILLSPLDNVTFSYQGVQGRQEAFDYLKSVMDDIDVSESLILAETTSLKDAISVYKFMKMCIEDDLVNNDDEFDIDDYDYGEEGE